MKKFFLLLCLIFLFVSFANAKDINLKFAWDAYPNATATGLKDIKIYQSTTSGNYDYSAPIKVVPQTITPSDTGSPSDISVTVNFPDGQKTTYYFVSQAFNDQDVNSLDSNEVNVTVDLTPLPAITNLIATYNKDTNSIDFGWLQNDPGRVKSWKLFQGAAHGGPYNEVANIIWDGSSNAVTASIQINQPEGTTVDYYFVVVAYGDYGVYSPDSNEVKVTIIRRPTPSKIMNLKVTIE